MGLRSALSKLRRDPIAFCLDARRPALNRFGQRLLDHQYERLCRAGARAAGERITVIMTAFNSAAFIEAAIRSVLAQSHENLELMVIDDASTDDTCARVLALAGEDERVRLFASPQNHGTYWSKNWCLSHAKSRFVAFHDSDDISHPDRLRVQLGALVSDPKRIACTVRWRRMTEAGRPVMMAGRSDRMALISLMIIRQPVVREAGFFDCVRIAADSEYLARLEHIFADRGVVKLRHILYSGLIRAGSLTTGGGDRLWQPVMPADDPSNRGNNAHDTDISDERGLEFERSLVGDRAHYHAAFKDWHQKSLANARSLRLDFPERVRAFPVPEALTRGVRDSDLDQVTERVPARP